MLQDKNKIDKFITLNVDNDNSVIYEYCKATTKKDKDYLRTRKARIKKQLLKAYTTLDLEALTPESVEKLILDKLCGKSKISESLIRMALDYLTKLKVKDISGTEQLDMKEFIKHVPT